MGRSVALVMMAVGFGLAIGGGYAFVFALQLLRVDGGMVEVHGLGPLNGPWQPPEYCLLGAVVSGVAD